MERVIYIVQWDHVNNQSLMYGSVVTQDIDRSIFYQNQMLAPGSIVPTIIRLCVRRGLFHY